MNESRSRFVHEAGGSALMEADLVYYRRRSAEEALAASNARDPRVRAVHLELAGRYRECVAELERQRVEVRLRLVPAA